MLARPWIVVAGALAGCSLLADQALDDKPPADASASQGSGAAAASASSGGDGGTPASGSGAAGGLGGSGGVVCPPFVPPANGECPDGVPGNCHFCDQGSQGGDNELCVFTCADLAYPTCRDVTNACAIDRECDVRCNGLSACEDAIIDCPPDRTCVVLCSGPRACANATVLCDEGACDVQCSGASADACEGLVVMCGAGACHTSCEAGIDPMPEVACGPTCECLDCSP
jgi:hypothetical protein